MPPTTPVTSCCVVALISSPQTSVTLMVNSLDLTGSVLFLFDASQKKTKLPFASAVKVYVASVAPSIFALFLYHWNEVASAATQVSSTSSPITALVLPLIVAAVTGSLETTVNFSSTELPQTPSFTSCVAINVCSPLVAVHLFSAIVSPSLPSIVTSPPFPPVVEKVISSPTTISVFLSASNTNASAGAVHFGPAVKTT